MNDYVYIAGPITGIENYEYNFQRAEIELAERGFTVFNPTKNKGNCYRKLINEGLTQLMQCDSIYMLKGWKKSMGATLEYDYALTTGMYIMFEGE